MIKKENSKLLSRLYNYKFEQAVQYLDGENSNVVEIVSALGELFGNPGWFTGKMSIIIDAALKSIKPEQEDEE